MTVKLFGWTPNPQGVEAFLNDPKTKHPLFGLAATELMESAESETVLLYEPLLSLKPSWTRGRQGIGDCVSWGYELGCTTLAAVDIVVRREPEAWKGEFATEPIYGGSRVEARGVKRGGWSDGSYGGAAAKWVRDWGCLLRKDYTADTGDATHDLRVYDPDRAKNWGNWGCGGRGDKEMLDDIAKEHPVKTVSMVTTFDEAAVAIANGYPVPVCSGQGFTSKRDKDGFCKAKGKWAHCMLFWGVRHGERPGLLLGNSWGYSCSGPVWPENQPDAVAACSWWVDATVVDRMLRGQDSYALSGYDGFKRREMKWDAGWL